MSTLASLAVVALALVPPDTGYVPGPDGVRLYYERVGTGGRTLIIPGRLFLAKDLAPLARTHTLILYDMRNRGRSSRVKEGALLTIQKDVEDLETVRRHFGVERFVPVGFSYLGLMVILYAMDHPDRVERLVQLGPVPRKFNTEYPASLSHRDSVPVVDSAAAARIDSLGRTEWARAHQRELCMESRRVFAARLVGRPRAGGGADGSLRHGERVAGKSPAALPASFRGRAAARRHPGGRGAVRVPVLTIHGTWDRNAPYAAGREWAMTLPDARLITVERAAHLVSL